MTNDTSKIKPKKKKNSELLQLLLSVFLIGVFVLIEIWLIFFYCSRYGYDNSTFLFPLIFGILTILMVCLSTLNVYQIFVKRTSFGAGGSDKKAEYMIYKQVKALPDSFKSEFEQLTAEIEDTQKKAAKIILLKVEEQLKQFKEENSGEGEASDNISDLKAQLSELESKISALNTQYENVSNQLNALSNDNESIKENFSDISTDHKKVFDLLGSVAFRNDEIKDLLIKVYADDRESAEENLDNKSENSDVDSAENVSNNDIVNMQQQEDYDPNKQLTPEEISKLFANV